MVQDHGWLLLSMSFPAFFSPPFCDFLGLIEFLSSSIQWFSGSTFHLAPVALRSQTGGSLSLWAQGTNISQACVLCSPHLLAKGEESESKGIPPLNTHTLILTLSSFSHFLSLLFSSLLSFRVSWHYIPCFFNHTTASKIQGLWFLCFFKKLYLWEKASLDIFSNLPFFSWVLASFRKVLASDLAYAPKGAFSKSMYLTLPPWDSETFPQGHAGPWLRITVCKERFWWCMCVGHGNGLKAQEKMVVIPWLAMKDTVCVDEPESIYILKSEG